MLRLCLPRVAHIDNVKNSVYNSHHKPFNHELTGNNPNAVLSLFSSKLTKNTLKCPEKERKIL